QLVSLSQGALSQDVIDDMVTRANGGTVANTDAEGPAGWQERSVAGRFEGRTAIVTGAASGIGPATASRIAREGGRVIAVDLADDRLAEFADQHRQQQVTTVAADITEAADIDRIVAAAGGRIDGLANVAGVVDDFSPVHEVS